MKPNRDIITLIIGIFFLWVGINAILSIEEIEFKFFASIFTFVGLYLVTMPFLRHFSFYTTIEKYFPYIISLAFLFSFELILWREPSQNILSILFTIPFWITVLSRFLKEIKKQ